MTDITIEKPPVALLTLNGVKSSPKMPVCEAYPLSRGISIITPLKTPLAAHKLISFFLSPQKLAIAGKNGIPMPAGAATRT